MRRLFVIAAVIVLVLVGVWITDKPMERFSLGRGEALITREGVDALLVGDGSGGWRRFGSGARHAHEGVAMPDGVVGRPAFDHAGAVFMLTADGLLRVGQGGSVETLVAPEALPDHAVLEGACGTDGPLLSAPVSGGAGGRRFHVLRSGGANGGGPLMVVADAAGEALAPAVGEIICSEASSTWAFRRGSDWEAWSFGGPDGPQRVVAAGCRSPGALFTPDGESLVLEGNLGGLKRLSLVDGSFEFMAAEANLGMSRRVPFGVGFHRHPNVIIAGPQWSMDGYLNIYSTHLSGRGRQQFKLAFIHHYAVSMSWNGRLIVYCQADFDEEDDRPFDEALYVFDYARATDAAIFLDDRPGGRPDVGPAFIGHADTLVYIADGTVHGVVFPTLESSS